MPEGYKQMADTSYIFGAGASYACSSKTPLITQFFARAKQIGKLCEDMRADVTESINRNLALDDTELLNGFTQLRNSVQSGCDGWRDAWAAQARTSSRGC